MSLHPCPGCDQPTSLDICAECTDAVETAVRKARVKRPAPPLERLGDPLIRQCMYCGRLNDGFCPCDGEGDDYVFD